MAEFMGKVKAVNSNETIEVELYAGGFKMKNGALAEIGPGHYRSLRRNRAGRPTRRLTGQALQFAWADVKNGPLKAGDTVMVELQPVSRPVRKI